MKKTLLIKLCILSLLLIAGCNKQPTNTEASSVILMPTRMTSLVIEPEFNGVFYANVLCRSEADFTNNTKELDILQIERQEFQQPFLEIFDDNIIMQKEEKINKKDYIEFRRYYMPEIYPRFFDLEFENKINISGSVAFCTTYNSFKFKYKYYDEGFMIKEGEYFCPYSDFRVYCHKANRWDCNTQFEDFAHLNRVYDCIKWVLIED